jgi:hypothetical protein
MTTQQRVSYDEWVGQDVYDADNAKIGAIEDLYYDTRTKRPEWMAVKTGMFGMKRNFVPMSEAQSFTNSDGITCLRVPYMKDQVKDAPQIDAGDRLLTTEEERLLYTHYGFDHQNHTDTFGTGNERFDRDYKTNWADTDEDQRDNDVIATETVKNERVETQPETVRLRKYRWTEQVPVQREEIRVEGDDAKR